MKIFNYNFFSKKNMFFVFLFFVAIFIFSLHNRVSHVDEGAIAENSYYFLKTGQVNADQLTGYFQSAGPKQLQYHKLFVLTGAFFVKIFGYSIYTFKFISLIFFLLFIFFLVKYINLKNFQYQNNNKLFVFLILLANPNIFFYSFLFRPEIMVMSLGFINFYFLIKGLETNKKSYIALAGIFSGLAFLTHMNGVIFCLSGFCFLLFKKNIKYLLIFSFFAMFFCCLYFFDIRSFLDLKNLYIQFTKHPNIVNNQTVLEGILTEQKRFFHSSKEIFFSVLFLFCLIFNFKYLKEKYKDELRYCFLLIIFLTLITVERRVVYALSYYPFMAIIIASFLDNFSNKNSKLKNIYFILFLFYISVSCFKDIEFIKNGFNIKKRNNEIVKFFNDKNLNIRVLAPESFIFNQIENYKIYGYLSFAFSTIEKENFKNKIYSYLNYAYLRNIKYVIIDKLRQEDNFDYADFNFLDNLKEQEIIDNYILIKKQDGFFIFEKIS